MLVINTGYISIHPHIKTNDMALNPVASERHDMELEKIETVACEAYISTSQQSLEDK